MNTYPDTDYISRAVEQWLVKKPRGLNMTIKPGVTPLSYEIGMIKNSEDGNRLKPIQWMLFAERLYQADDPIEYILDNLETMYAKLMKEETKMPTKFAEEIKTVTLTPIDNDHMLKMAKAAVVAWYNEHNAPATIGMEDVYIAWFCKVLQNWKALAGTHHSDGMYYEVTYDGDKDAAYVDAYKKWQNVSMRGEDIRDNVRRW